MNVIGRRPCALAKGDAQKRRAATAMNDRSSRAHAVFTLALVQRDEATGRELRSRLCLADLGGVVVRVGLE